MKLCESYDEIIRKPSEGDKARRYALRKLVEKACLKSLYNHALTYSRMDWIRNYSLLALTKFANLNTQSNTVAITLQEEEIILGSDIDITKMREKAAKLLFLYIITPDKPSKFKKIALMGLLAGNHSEYLEEILKDTIVEQWIKKTISSAKKVRKKRK